MTGRILRMGGVMGISLLVLLGSYLRAEEVLPFRIIPVPAEEHGYANFETMVIRSQVGLEMFFRQILSTDKPMGWNNQAGFLAALVQAGVDFDREVLVFLRHTEGSGAVTVDFKPPRVENGTLLCQIHREAPEAGTADMAYYCFALVVTKTDVAAVEIRVEGREAVLLPLTGEADEVAEATPDMPDAPLSGGWSPADVTDAEVIAAAHAAVKAMEKTLRTEEGGEDVTLALVEIRAAEKQVVAGMNFRLKLTVRRNAEETEAAATVWWQAWREPEPYQLTEWGWE